MSHKFFNKYVNKRIRSLFRMCISYKGTSPKKKTDLSEMIVHGCMAGTLNKQDLQDISIKQAKQILNKNSITINSLPGHGNMRLKKKEIKPCIKEKPFIKF